MRFFIEFSYKGTNYHGWQFQPNAITVQEVLEMSISKLLGEKIELTAAGRTDTGVHAIQMFAHFDYKNLISDNLVYQLNSFLPIDIAIKNVYEVNTDAHARFDAIERTYHYLISTKKNVFKNALAYNYYHYLDIALMNRASQLLFSHRDFQCFSKSKTDVKTYNCKVTEANWAIDDEMLRFTITADRFLRNMVRAIVGTLINIGTGKNTIADLEKILASKNRSEAGYSVPAHGLYLAKVKYPESIFVTK